VRALRAGGLIVEKLTSILAVVEDVSTDAAVLDKALALARTFRARLVILLRRPAQDPIGATLRAAAGTEVETVTNADDPLTEALLRQLQDHPADLVIKRAATTDRRRPWLATDDDELAEDCPVPLLLVRDRPWSEEPRFAAAVDISDRDTESLARSILHTSGFLTLGCEAWLDVLYSEREQHDQTLRMERAVRLARLVREFHVGGERLQVFDGAPDKTLPAQVRARRYDVLVAGAVSRRHTPHSAYGTLTNALVRATTGDVLLVKAAEPVRDQPAAAERSGREQLAYQL
jgi:nucleotide-binding universal stress UspA family protein